MIGFMTASAWTWILSIALLQSVQVQHYTPNCFARAHDHDEGTTPVDELPKNSEDFLAFHSCDNVEELKLPDNEEDDSFFRWVLSARHTTWTPGWEVAMPRSASNATGEDENYYARVFDLLNWSRKQELLPMPIAVSSICHKGMESQYMGGIRRWTDDNNIPKIPNGYIPSEMWSNLWNTCHKKLQSTTRTSSSCIDIPGVLVANPNPPLQVNNPCHMEYRVVDGAHRICLRKYLLALLTGELMELEELAKEEPNDKISMDSIQNQMQEKQRLIDRTKRGPFLVLNQTTFQSMLMSTDPHESWAKDRQLLMKDVTKEFQLEWGKWMGHVMNGVQEITYDD